MGWNLDFISKEELKSHVRATIMKYGEKLDPFDLKRFNSNLIDPKLCMTLPEIIESVVSEEGGISIPHDTVIQELRNVAKLYDGQSEDLAMAMAVYMLGFNTYLGFGSQVGEKLPEVDDGMLKRVYAYAKKFK